MEKNETELKFLNTPHLRGSRKENVILYSKLPNYTMVQE